MKTFKSILYILASVCFAQTYAVGFFEKHQNDNLYLTLPFGILWSLTVFVSVATYLLKNN